MGHIHHGAEDLVSSELDSSSDEEDVWDPFMDFQEGEPTREVNILMLPKVEQDEDGLTITVTGDFERLHPMIYIGMKLTII